VSSSIQVASAESFCAPDQAHIGATVQHTAQPLEQVADSLLNSSPESLAQVRHAFETAKLFGISSGSGSV